jgi:hypothetical protein
MWLVNAAVGLQSTVSCSGGNCYYTILQHSLGGDLRQLASAEETTDTPLGSEVDILALGRAQDKVCMLRPAC